jgi:SAM-dependent MidA family methyltransferase
MSFQSESTHGFWQVTFRQGRSSAGRRCRYAGTVSDLVANRIRRAIEEHGPISFAEFMEHALYGPDGFYERRAVGVEGHFITSPHVHPIFGEILLRALAALGEAMGAVDPLCVVEVGAGDGTLAGELLRLAEVRGGLRLDYQAVERSSTARARLAELPLRVVDRIDALSPIEGGIVFANEVLDNLPFGRVRATAEGLVEVRVGVEDGRFVEVDVPCEGSVGRSAPDMRPGQEATVPAEALDVVNRIAGFLRTGYVLLIDYGSEAGPGGDVHGYREHRPWDDVLREPGSADITAGVDFGAVARHAASRGLVTMGLVTQRDAMLSLGYGDWDREQRERQGRLLAGGPAGLATRVWEGRSRASILVDPAQLGCLRWLLLATDGLPSPRWMSTILADGEASGTARRSPV